MYICDDCKYRYYKDDGLLCVPCFNKDGACLNYVKEGDGAWHVITHLQESIMEKEQKTENES